MRNPSGFEILPHTADLRGVLQSPEVAGLAQAAVDFARVVLVGDSPVAAAETRVIQPEGEDEGERFFRFLRELFYLFDVELWLPATVAGSGPWTIAGEGFDPAHHMVEHQVKGLTRHGYRYERGGAGYRVQVVLDL